MVINTFNRMDSLYMYLAESSLKEYAVCCDGLTDMLRTRLPAYDFWNIVEVGIVANMPNKFGLIVSQDVYERLDLSKVNWHEVVIYAGKEIS